jgi:hypothetical protein
MRLVRAVMIHETNKKSVVNTSYGQICYILSESRKRYVTKLHILVASIFIHFRDATNLTVAAKVLRETFKSYYCAGPQIIVPCGVLNIRHINRILFRLKSVELNGNYEPYFAHQRFVRKTGCLCQN